MSIQVFGEQKLRKLAAPTFRRCIRGLATNARSPTSLAQSARLIRRSSDTLERRCWSNESAGVSQPFNLPTNQPVRWSTRLAVHCSPTIFDLILERLLRVTPSCRRKFLHTRPAIWSEAEIFILSVRSSWQVGRWFLNNQKPSLTNRCTILYN